MTKMNRRDYLMQMGAGAAAVAGLAEEVLAQSQGGRRRRRPTRKPNQSTNKTSAAATGLYQFTNWPATDVRPSMESPVTLIFEGLFGFFYNGSCDLRYHPGNRHRALILIWHAGSNTPEEIQLPPKCKRLSVEINRPQSMVRFFERYPDRPFNDRENGDEMDFRWLLDLDSADFYANHNFDLLQSKFNRTLRVRHGTFFTALTTCSTFSRVNVDDNDSNPLSMGHMPRFMGAALNPNPGEYVSLLFQEIRSNQFVNYDSRTFRPADGNVQVQFLNHCYAEFGCPRPKPQSSHDEERNDFHFVRETLNLRNVPRYGIKINSDCDLDDRKVSSDRSKIRGFDHLHMVSSDNAPCMGAGFGGR